MPAAAVHPVLARVDDNVPNFTDKLTKIRDMITSILNLSLKWTMRISRLLYCVMAIAGAALWTSRVESFTGRDLIIGAVVLAFVSEFVMPLLL